MLRQSLYSPTFSEKTQEVVQRMTNNYKTEEMIEDITRLEQDIEAESIEFDYLDEIEEWMPYE